MTTPQISNFSNLDFDASKAELIAFLQTQTEYQDVNFEGSGIQLLVNALTYTYNQLSQYANMSISECFLDSAQLRSSVVSRAKEMNYIPQTPHSANATLQISLVLGPSNTGFTNIYIPAYTNFAATFNGSNFSFVTLQRYQMLEALDINGNTLNPGTYLATIQVYEGVLTTETFTIQSGLLPAPRYRLSNTQLDSDTLVVTTLPNVNSSNATSWSPAGNIVNVGPTSTVFWLQENSDGYWEIYFGDNSIGMAPTVGSVLNVQYLFTHNVAANGINQFVLTDNITQQNTSSAPVTYPATAFTVSVVSVAANGSAVEATESVRTNAPLFWKAQNRTVTVPDYIAILQSQYGYIQTLSVWGGESNTPPEYGRVFISIKPVYGLTLSPATKQSILTNLQTNYSILGITPMIVDPNYTFVNVTTNVTYNKALTTLSDGELSNNIQQSIQTFFTSTASSFNSAFYFSKFVAAIDATDPSILGNETTLQVFKTFVPLPNQISAYSFNFANQLQPGSISTNAYTSTANQIVQLKDDSLGNLNVYVNNVLFRSAVGTVNYTTGVININNFAFAVNPNTTLSLFATPTNEDIFVIQNNLISLNLATVVLNPLTA